ncbi:MAG TPA: SDR family NAD(P)-dependent oxidoreductase, partial [Casimicrobiaceae bacterium]|nr:SDR family NAD(P)-dependent oxidoreductase [Casimicrobiaceae bacterium]
VEQFGGVDVLINNAGIVRWAGFPEADEENLARHLAVHVGGSFNTTRAAWPHMAERGYGRVVMTTSTGLFGLPNNVSYATAKAGVIGLTRSLATAAARHGITVNAIAPGFVLTEGLRARIDSGLLDHDVLAQWTPVGRWAQPAEIARVACFLADPASSYITGTTIPVDGGFSIRGDPNELSGAIS